MHLVAHLHPHFTQLYWCHTLLAHTSPGPMYVLFMWHMLSRILKLQCLLLCVHIHLLICLHWQSSSLALYYLSLIAILLSFFGSLLHDYIVSCWLYNTFPKESPVSRLKFCFSEICWVSSGSLEFGNQEGWLLRYFSQTSPAVTALESGWSANPAIQSILNGS